MFYCKFSCQCSISWYHTTFRFLLQLVLSVATADMAAQNSNSTSISWYHTICRFLLQLVLSVATADMAAQNSNSTLLLPSTTHVINLADSHDRAAFTAASQMKEEPMDIDGHESSSLDVSLCINI